MPEAQGIPRIKWEGGSIEGEGPGPCARGAGTELVARGGERMCPHSAVESPLFLPGVFHLQIHPVHVVRVARAGFERFEAPGVQEVATVRTPCECDRDVQKLWVVLEQDQRQVEQTVRVQELNFQLWQGRWLVRPRALAECWCGCRRLLRM